MVTGPRDASPHRGAPNGVAGRFRPLGTSGEIPDPSPPEFASAPWGYRRAEVDAWASWVAGLVAQSRAETVRADSAEATLRATIEQLEQLERREKADHATAADPADLPRRQCARAPGPTPASSEPVESGPTPASPTPASSTSGPATTDAAADPSPAPTPDPAPEASHRGPASEDVAGLDPPLRSARPAQGHGPGDTARWAVIESTLGEVMRLLHRMFGPEQPVADRGRSPNGS